MLLVGGCATSQRVTQWVPPTQALPSLRGSYHQVRAGETLWRIARSYGVSIGALASVNRLSSTSRLTVGQQLYIPLPVDTSRFLWPVRGRVHPSNLSNGVEIAADAGSVVRASRTGRVAVATRQLSGWGKTVVMDHVDGYLSIYSGFEQVLVSPGMNVRQGVPIGTLGARSLHFEIRYGTMPKNPLGFLPQE